jgi:hypothetical protein
MSSLSPFDKRLLEEGLTYFDRPRLASLLEMLGSSTYERVEALATMLRHCAPEEHDEALAIFERAAARAARQWDWEEEYVDRDGAGDARRRRYSASAERRAQRRRSE